MHTAHFIYCIINVMTVFWLSENVPCVRVGKSEDHFF